MNKLRKLFATVVSVVALLLVALMVVMFVLFTLQEPKDYDFQSHFAAGVILIPASVVAVLAALAMWSSYRQDKD